MKRALLVAAIVLTAGVLVLLVPSGRTASQELVEVVVRNWPDAFRVKGPVEVVGGPLRQAELVARTEVIVPPVGPNDTARLIDAGVLETDRYPAVVLSLAGQPRGQIGKSGMVGAILLPDVDFVQQAFDEARLKLFALQVSSPPIGLGASYFSSDQPYFRTAFPRYRILLYNTTDKSVTANVYAYLTQ